jgi:MYXO-CTERM domain-containing protein
MEKERRKLARISFVVLSASACMAASSAAAATNQFHGVNWADPGDNFQAGVLYVSGLSSSDTYNSALAVGNVVMDQLVSKLGANSVRLPINEATVSKFWSTYTGAIDAVLSKGMVVLCYWDSAKSNKPADMNAFWAMWKTVVDKYGGNDRAYFEIFNEPNMYSKTDLGNLYNSWLTQFPTVPKGRVILDGTGNAQNVSDVGSDSRLSDCLLAVHDYSFFGSASMTSESQWVSQFKDEVGNYADRTVCTEWGGPMSPGSKNGVSYGYLDYSTAPTNYFEAYIRGISSQLRSWNMGSFYWAGLKDGDWYSMTVKSGSGAAITLSIPNQSGLDRLQYAWTGPSLGGIDAGAAGVGGRDAAAEGGAGGVAGSSAVGGGSGSGGANANSGGAGGARTGQSGAGGAAATGGAAAGSGATAAAGGAAASSSTISSGGGPGTIVMGSGGAGGSTSPATTHSPIGGAAQSSGCSCTVGRPSPATGYSPALLLGLFAVAFRAAQHRRRSR